jgi:hypothetical protein
MDMVYDEVKGQGCSGWQLKINGEWTWAESRFALSYLLSFWFSMRV